MPWNALPRTPPPSRWRKAFTSITARRVSCGRAFASSSRASWLNQKASLGRRDLERLEAILTNCVRFGPQSQNRAGHADFRAHLEGRVGFVAMIDPLKGQKFKEPLKAIQWER